ncbi:S8 family peptidase [Tepidibacillus infernus]|uniref:Peptidase S8/S53 domain-containing protein n=1 Tax=Tepidibacillus decaturensis TaxID=1413211 RepID=A0A135L5M5_9BACI|nr:S8 family peptidase [Tepidibacillus decaturensis]KXG44286.1 hypothetical protein U473_09925 [Tepidibacillus decaturensis]
MTPHPWHPHLFLRQWIEDQRGRRNQQYEHKILFLRPNASARACYRDLRLCRIRNLKYLKHLHAFVGLFPKDYPSSAFRNHPALFQVEEDIDVQIFIPVKGKVTPKAQVVPWGIRRIGAEKAWSKTQGKGVRVAVLDTGIAYDHPDLHNNVKGGVNILNPLLPPYDHNGHGTHVAGTIGAVNNQFGVVGVAPKVDLYAVKAFNKDGTAKLSDIIKAIDWCIGNGIQIINMSFGFNEPSASFREAIARAHQAGIIMIAASGNKGTRGRLEYPAQFEETIAVSSINEQDQISKFSTIGPNIDLAAPGEKITSTWLNDSFRELSGTSMAVAHVSGVAALMLSRYPNLTPQQLSYMLRRSATRLKDSSSFAQGFGVVNASVLAERAVGE